MVSRTVYSSILKMGMLTRNVSLISIEIHGVTTQKIALLKKKIVYILSLVGGEVACLTYMMGSGLNDWIYWHFTHTQLGTIGNTSLSLIYTLYSSPSHTHTHTLRFSVFTSRIQATDLSVSLSVQRTHAAFFSQPNLFLAIILQLPTQFTSSAPKLISWQAGV
jgi:hypothetical protein